MPPVRYVEADVLGGAHAAYDAASGQILINADLQGTDLAAQAFVEEAGHHLDTLLNVEDTAGDEGEMFRRLLSGEQLSEDQLAAIRADNDHGTIVVDGKQVEVEFWSLRKTARKARRAARKVTKDARDTVRDSVKASVDFSIHGLNGMVRSSEALLRGDPEAAAKEGWRTLRDGNKQLVNQFIADNVRVLVDSADFVDTLSGDLKERRLTDKEIAHLRRVYGDNLDYDAIRIQRGGVRERIMKDGICIGNDIWMDKSHFDADGSLNDKGFDLLVHEAAHAWQYQQGGPGYIGDSLTDQIRNGRGRVGTGGAYDWLEAANRGVRFEDMTAEQQAELAMYIGRALAKAGPDGELTEGLMNEVLAAYTNGARLSPAGMAVVQDAQRRLHGH